MFKDHFSNSAESYAAFRPAYPDELIERIARLPSHRRLALDCGTGNGQAAIALAKHFQRVIATDASTEQLQHALVAANVEYRQAAAEATGLGDESVDLVTAAQALHWFDIDAFFREARRILTVGGAIAVWGYGDPVLDDPVLHATLHRFNRETLEPYWLPERAILLDGYRTIEFPFREIVMPDFALEARWTLRQLTGLLRTWSAVARYTAERGRDPIPDVEAALAGDWGDRDEQHLVSWPLHVRAGLKPVAPRAILRR